MALRHRRSVTMVVCASVLMHSFSRDIFQFCDTFKSLNASASFRAAMSDHAVAISCSSYVVVSIPKTVNLCYKDQLIYC